MYKEVTSVNGTSTQTAHVTDGGEPVEMSSWNSTYWPKRCKRGQKLGARNTVLCLIDDHEDVWTVTLYKEASADCRSEPVGVIAEEVSIAIGATRVANTVEVGQGGLVGYVGSVIVQSRSCLVFKHKGL